MPKQPKNNKQKKQKQQTEAPAMSFTQSSGNQEEQGPNRLP